MKTPIRLLLLEDNPSDAELALHALEAGGFACEARTVADRAGFEAAFAAGGFDLVISDNRLPSYSGLEALAHVRAHDRLVPFILLSGTLAEERAVAALQAGATDFVVKDNLARLAPAVRRALAEARERALRQHAQAELEKSENRYRAIVEEQSELIVRTLPDFTITFVNGAYCRFHRASREALLGRNRLERVRPEEHHALRRAAAAVTPQQPSGERLAIVVDGAGRTRRVQWSLRGVFDASGAVRELQGVGRDVTELYEANAALEAARGRLHRLSRRLIEVQEEERSRLSRELHDEIGQALTALKISLSSLARLHPEDRAFQDRIRLAVEAADQSLDSARRLAQNLRPPQIDDLGIAAALRTYLERQAALAGFAPHFEAQEPPRRFPREVETACFRVAQEALTNVVRHARAANVWLRLFLPEGRVALSVRDDGCGFDPAAAGGSSVGLVGMEERVALAGGSLDLRSAPGAGTTVVAVFPAGGSEGA